MLELIVDMSVVATVALALGLIHGLYHKLRRTSLRALWPDALSKHLAGLQERADEGARVRGAVNYADQLAITYVSLGVFAAPQLQSSLRNFEANPYTIAFLCSVTWAAARASLLKLVFEQASISVREVGSILKRASDAVHLGVALAPDVRGEGRAEGAFDMRSWRRQYHENFERILIPALEEMCGMDRESGCFTTNVMWYLPAPREPNADRHEARRTVWEWLADFLATELMGGSRFKNPYSGTKGSLRGPFGGYRDLRGEVFTAIKTPGSPEPALRIPVHSSLDDVLPGAPRAVANMLERLRERGAVPHGGAGKHFHPAFERVYEQDTARLTFATGIHPDAEAAVRDYFAKAPSVRSVVCVAFTTNAEGLAEQLGDSDGRGLTWPVGVLNINASVPSPLGDGRRQQLVFNALQIYVLALAGWLGDWDRHAKGLVHGGPEVEGSFELYMDKRQLSHIEKIRGLPPVPQAPRHGGPSGGGSEDVE